MSDDVNSDDLAMALEYKPLVGLQPISRVSQAECTARHADVSCPMRPMIVEDGCSEWEAMQWTSESMCEEFYDIEFAVHSATEDSQPMAFNEFMTNHANSKTQDDPLYLFETLIGGADGNALTDAHAKILSSYTDPVAPKLDMLTFSSNGARPGYRWILLGGRSSGTALHVDPYGTSAWNALLFGAKRWVLFSPETPTEWLEQVNRSGPKSAANWFGNIWPQYREILDQLPPKLQPMGCIQYPGEVIYVPSGWHHVVINLELSAALTHNYAHPRDFVAVRKSVFCNLWKSMEHLDSACEWNDAVRAAYPEIGSLNRCVRCDKETHLRLSLLGGLVLCRDCALGNCHLYGILSAKDAKKRFYLRHCDSIQELPSFWYDDVQYFLRAHLHELAEEIHGSVDNARAMARIARRDSVLEVLEGVDDAEEMELCRQYAEEGIYVQD